MEFRQIEAFANVVKHKSFSKAADASYLTQPTISQHVTSLEKELGVILLNRKSREIVPTEVGKEFYNFATDMINIREKAIIATQKEKEKLSGIIDISASTVPVEVYLPEIMAGFNREHPEVKFYLEVIGSRRVIDNVAEKRVELGFVGEKVEGSGLRYHKIYEDELVLIISGKDDRKINSEFISIEDILKDPFIWREKGSGTRLEFETLLKSLGHKTDKLEVVAIMDSMEAIKQSVAAGLGVSIISKSLVKREVEAGILKMYHIEGLHEKREFYMTYNKYAQLPATVEAFKEYVINNKWED